MPQDNLTESFRDMLGESGIQASDTDISSFLGEKLDIFEDKEEERHKNVYWKWPLTADKWSLDQSFPSDTSPLPFQGETGQPTRITEEEEAGSLLTFVGSGLWSFLDTAAFGLPGAFVKEEEHIDYDSAAAKWGSAIGGLGGFILGGPKSVLQLTGKGASKLATYAAGKETAAAVTKRVLAEGSARNLSKAAITDSGKVLSNLSRMPGTSTMKSEVFTKTATGHIGKLLKSKVAQGDLSTDQAAIIGKMFKDNLTRVPLADMAGILARSGFGARTARGLGRMYNEAIGFAVVDSLFEASSTLEDGHFDLTAPIWGGITGLAFGSLGFLNPVGKSAKWKTDFTDGLRATFGRRIDYSAMGDKKLLNLANFFGLQLERTPKTGKGVAQAGNRSPLLSVKWGKKETHIDLTSEHGAIKSSLIEVAGKKNWKKALDMALDKERKWYGRELVRWANKQGIDNLKKHWWHMMAGGTVFNARTFYEAWAHDMELDIHDILPHFLIGAALQIKHGQKLSFDFTNPVDINKFRQGLMILNRGNDVRQLNDIPTFAIERSSFDNVFVTNPSRYNKLIKMAKDMGIISDEISIIDARTADGEVTLGAGMKYDAKKGEIVQGVSTIDPTSFEMFRELHMHLRPLAKHRRSLDQITEKDAKRLIDEFRKVHPDAKIDNVADMVKILDEGQMRASEQFERVFSSVILDLKNTTLNKELKDAGLEILFNEDLSNTDGNSLVKTLTIGTDLLKRAHDGEFGWLGRDDKGIILRGGKAERKLIKLADSYNSIVKMHLMINTAKIAKGELNEHSIKNESSLKDLYEVITRHETNVDKRFPNKSALYSQTKFSFKDNFDDYFLITYRNNTVRGMRQSADVFSLDFKERSTLMTKLRKAKVLDEQADFSIYSNMDHITITGTDNTSRLKQAKRRLERIQSLVAASQLGQKTGMKVIEGAEASSKEINISTIDSLVDFLRSSGVDIRYIKGNFFQTFESFLLRERIDGTTLSMADMDMALNLVRNKMAGYKPNKEGVNSIVLRTIQLSDGMKFLDSAREYNIIVENIADRSNGLVTIAKEKMVVLDEGVVQMLHQTIVDAGSLSSGAGSVRAVLTDFINSLHVNNSQIKHMIAAAVSEGRQNQVFSWLVGAGILKRTSDNLSKPYELRVGDKTGVIELSKSEIVDFTKALDRFGIDAEFAERHFESESRFAKNISDGDPADKVDVRNMSLQEFYRKYGFEDYSVFVKEGLEPSEVIEGQKNHLDNLLFDGGTGKGGVKKNLVNHILSKMSVRKSDSFVKYADLDKGSKVRYKRILMRDLYALMGSKFNQTQVNLIKNNYSSLEAEVELRQKDSFIKYFRDELGLNFWFIDPESYTYEVADDSKTLTLRYFNMFEYGSGNTTSKQRSKLRAEFDLFKSNLNALGDKKLISEEGEVSGDTGVPDRWAIIRLSPVLSPIAIPKTELHKLLPALEKIKEQYAKNPEVAGHAQEFIDTLIKSVSSGKIEDVWNFKLGSSVGEIQSAFEMVFFENMLVSKDGSDFFVKNYLNATDGAVRDKVRQRVKLYNTPNFVRYEKDLIDQLKRHSTQKSRDSFERTIMSRRGGKGGWNVAIWEDEANQTVFEMVEKWAKTNGIKDWKWDQNLGNAHKDASEFDSIAFVNRDIMRAVHTLLGHNPESLNPIKPIISSHGADAPLLYGKTLFVHSPELNGFFESNKNLDILLTRSGAKITNEHVKTEADQNLRWLREKVGKDGQRSKLRSEDINVGRIVESEKIYELPLDAIGLKPEADKRYTTAKRSVADYNFFLNNEVDSIWKDDYRDRINTEITKMRALFQDPIRLRAVMMGSEGDQILFNEMTNISATNQLFGMQSYLALSKFADPMSYSERMTMSKMYSKHFDYIMNGFRSTVDMKDKGDYFDRIYGGQAPLIQLTSGVARTLRPTLVKNNGDFVSRGEAMLPFYAAEQSLDAVTSAGFELRITKGKFGVDVESLEDFIIRESKDKKGTFKGYEKGGYKDFIADMTLGKLFERLNHHNDTKGENVQVGIIARRNPRTRPNDMTILSLKGFLDERNGNSLILNPFDVVNVYEGDYDYDKADYFFAHRKGMYDHIQRTGAHFVQGIDPKNQYRYLSDDLTMNPDLRYLEMEKIWADGSIFSKSIGKVQKIPRKLNFLSHIGVQNPTDEVGKLLRRKRRGTQHAKEDEFYDPHILWSDKDGYRLIMDYDNYDFFQRQAFETQLMIDASHAVDGKIFNRIDTWADDFLFPRLDNKSAIASPINGEHSSDSFANDRAGFVRDVRNAKNRDLENLRSKRVRIFRKVRVARDGTLEEVELDRSERAIIKTMMSEYGKLLNVSGNMMFENGNQRAAKYQDIVDASKRFFGFLENPSDKIFYSLRYQYIDPSNPSLGRWIDDKFFKNKFAPERIKVKGKRDYHIPKKDIWDVREPLTSSISDNMMGMLGGTRGNILERSLYQLKSEDPMSIDVHWTTPGDKSGLVDRWYAELMFRNNNRTNIEDGISDGEFEAMTKKFDEQIFKVSGALKDINKNVQIIQSLKKKFGSIQRNQKLNLKTKKKMTDGINKKVEEAEKALRKMVTAKYGKTKKGLDLEKMTTVSVQSGEDVIKGSIQFGTIFNIKNAYGQSRLDDAASKDLKLLKKLRKSFYGNRTKYGDWYKYSPMRDLMPREIRDFLGKIHDMSDFYEIETKLLDHYVINKDYGLAFLWEYMSPIDNKYAVGIHNNNPVETPYGPTGRYNRGYQYLVGLANRKNPEYKAHSATAREALIKLQMTEHNMRNFFRNKTDLKYKIGTVLEVKDKSTGKMISLDLSTLQLPDFHRDFQDYLANYKNIGWKSTSDRMLNNFDLINDHMIDFYRNVVELQGFKPEEYNRYISVLDDMRQLMISNRTINPFEYMTIMNDLNGQMRELTRTVLAKGIDSYGNDVAANALRSNPVFILMGGETMWSNSLEKQPLNSERQRQSASDFIRSINDIKENIKQSKSKADFEKVKRECM